METEAREGGERGTVMALYPHHWDNATSDLTDLSYASPRGEMRVVEGPAFTTELTTHGVLPSLPTVDSADHDRMRLLIDEVLAESELFPEPGDTYWDGKAMGRLAQLVPIADSLGYTEARDEMLDLSREVLSAGGLVAGICGATYGLARAGLLNDRDHTSNAADYLASAPGYQGADHYREAKSVVGQGLITALATAPIDFARAVFEALEVFPQPVIDAWYGLYTTGERRFYDALVAA